MLGELANINHLFERISSWKPLSYLYLFEAASTFCNSPRYGKHKKQIYRQQKIATRDIIVHGVIGLGSCNWGGPDAQGFYIGRMIQYFIQQSAEIAYVCEDDTRRYERGLNPMTVRCLCLQHTRQLAGAPEEK